MPAPLTRLLSRRGTLPLRTVTFPARKRCLHLAPPFLIDPPYVPSYLTLPPSDEPLKRSLAHSHLSNCNLCPRLCSVNRYQTTGVCLIGAETVKVNTIAPHFGEEPCIQGHNGSGSVFFSMCNLRCVFCQNHDISHVRSGFDLTPEQLGEWFIKLQDVGNVHNINLVTPEHVVPQVALSILHAKSLGLKIPIIYNTSSYDSLSSLSLLSGLVDIYLADFKVWSPATAQRLLKAEDYPEAARDSIRAMQDQVGDLKFTPDGIAQRGLLVRHLVMPGLESESAEIMKFLAQEVSRDCFVNIMEQYRPAAYVGGPKRAGGESKEKRYQEINRPVTKEEVCSVREAAEAAGLWRFCDPPRHDGFNI
ncbi:hypothetical protein QBC42DRAFT_259600 [Cladorrhinum samala]|uniref:Radical SAM core domain-containing protein n=1 Tax=Cladorrhinum samala TaxID=585594 RepID=A0AAV9I5A4_9PEZI|nr:hypothetical protein QBC42DRAFT_259600 [Cladorrhinum samala]